MKKLSNSLKRLSIKQKLFLMIIGFSAVCFLVSFSLFLAYDFYEYNSNKRQELQSLARLIGRNNTVFSEYVGLLEQAKSSTQQDLYKVLSLNPDIKHACIFDKNDSIFAFYDRSLRDSVQENANTSIDVLTQLEPDSSDVDKDAYYDVNVDALLNAGADKYSNNPSKVLAESDFSPNIAKINTPAIGSYLTEMLSYLDIYLNEKILNVKVEIKDKSEETVATVLLREDLNRSLERYGQYFSIVAFIFVVIFSIASAIVLKMQKSISGPIIHLSKFTKKVSEDNDYSQRITNLQKAEIGQLQRDINELLDVIQRRETELIAAKEKAEEFARAKQNFLAHMSHEIRTPMNGVTGATQILEDTELDDYQQKWVNSLRVSAAHLMEIINDILDISKIESGKMSIAQIPFSVKEVIAAVVDGNSSKCKEKRLLVTKDIDEQVPELLKGDEVRLKQILMNLFGNAIKFTQKGFIAIGCKTIEDTQEAIALQFYVKDTGIGIASENFDKIFQNFTQEKSDTTKEYGGTGLGLSICKSLVDMQGGEMFLESKVGKGSKFYFNITYQKLAEDELSANLKQHKKVKMVMPPFEPKKKILVAEDNETNQEVVKNFLGQWNIEVDLAPNGKIAVQKIESDSYDLVLMDLHMPELDGYGATRTIRKELNHGKNKVPIIAMTAAALQDESDKCLASGMNGYVTKPLDRQVLYQKIKEYLS